MLLPRYASGEAARLSIVREEIETPTGRQGVAQPGRALASDARGRRIEACHPDQIASVAQRESHRLISDGSRVRLLSDAPNRYHRSMIGMRRCEEAKRRSNPESAAWAPSLAHAGLVDWFGVRIAGRSPLKHDPEKLQTFRTRSCSEIRHDPEKLQTFRTGSCSEINEMRARCDSA